MYLGTFTFQDRSTSVSLSLHYTYQVSQRPKVLYRSPGPWFPTPVRDLPLFPFLWWRGDLDGLSLRSRDDCGTIIGPVWVQSEDWTSDTSLFKYNKIRWYINTVKQCRCCLLLKSLIYGVREVRVCRSGAGTTSTTPKDARNFLSDMCPPDSTTGVPVLFLRV